MKRKFPNPYAEETSLEVENEVAKNLFVSVGYQFVHGLKLPVYLSINGVPNGTLPTGVQSFTPADPTFRIHSARPRRRRIPIYHAGTLSVRKPFAQHYSILANYTYSKSIDISTDIQLTDTPMDYLHPNLDRGLGDNDVRHRLVLTLLGESSNTLESCAAQFQGLDVKHSAKSRVTTRSWPALT